MVADLIDPDAQAWNNFVMGSDPRAADGEYRQAAISNQFMGVANNGGLNAFLTASNDLDATEVHQALLAVGAFQAAAALGRILIALAEPLRASTQEERWAALDRLWLDELDEHDVLSEKADTELLAALQRHVARNRDYYLQLTE